MRTLAIVYLALTVFAGVAAGILADDKHKDARDHVSAVMNPLRLGVAIALALVVVL